MKPFILITLLLLSTMHCFAFDTRVSDTAIVNINNETGYDCVLTKQFILSGRISDRVYLQSYIAKDQTMTFTMNSEIGYFNRKAFLLTYVCSEDQSVTIFSDINYYDGLFISQGRTIKSQHIYAHFQNEYNNYWRSNHKPPVVINWTFYRSSK